VTSSNSTGPDELTLAQVMLPEDANPRGNVHGGTLMKLADTAGGVCASRHTRRRVVTVVMDSMTFEEPVYVGNLVVVHAQVTWTGRTSIETEVSITAEDALSGEVRHISTAYFVYVALDENGHPTPVRPLEVTTAEERARWQAAEARRANRLRHRPQPAATP
jgi:uncharacterized protein (TIGR00369 family)